MDEFSLVKVFKGRLTIIVLDLVGNYSRFTWSKASLGLGVIGLSMISDINVKILFQ